MMKLVKGQGSYGSGACWMSAIRYYETLGNKAKWSDHPECVDPAIRVLCINLNDRLNSDEERERVIGPHLFAPLGTAGDPALTLRRAFYCADQAVRVFAADALESVGREKDAAKLRALPEVIDAGTARAAANAANAAGYAGYAGYAAGYAGYAAANAAANAASYGATNAASYAASYAAAAATYAASYAAANAAANAANAAANAATYAAAASTKILQLILDLCSMSSQPELDSNMVRRVLVEACKYDS